MVNDDCIATPTMILAAQEAERKHYGINRGAGFRSTGAMELKKLIEAALVQRKKEALRAHNSEPGPNHSYDNDLAMAKQSAHNRDSAEPVAFLVGEDDFYLAKQERAARVMAKSAEVELHPLYLASPPAKEVIDDGRWKRIYDALAKEGGATWATYMMIDIEALTNRTPDDEVGNG